MLFKSGRHAAQRQTHFSGHRLVASSLQSLVSCLPIQKPHICVTWQLIARLSSLKYDRMEGSRKGSADVLLTCPAGGG